MKVKVNNINIYYEVYGEGRSIILLHGNGQSHEIYKKLVNSLKKEFKVYILDSRCHGKSEDAKEVSYDLMRDDVIGFIKKLEIDKPILYGFSDGGIVGLEIAIKSPSCLAKLIVSGVNLNPQGLKWWFKLGVLVGYFFSRGKLLKLMLREPKIELEDLKNIKIPVIILAGEKDIVKEKHTRMINENICNSVMEVVLRENHGSYVVNSDKLYNIIRKYL